MPVVEQREEAEVPEWVEVAKPKPDEESADAQEPEVAPLRENASFLTDAQPVVHGFLEATTVEELLKFVDRPELVAERIKRYHPDGTIDAPGLADYSQFSHVRRNGPYGMVPLRTGDFQIRMMALREYPEEMRVDWESWVGWSEMSWEDFTGQRPSEPNVFRVYLSPVQYYNFEFADESQWQSYRLMSPDQEHSLYAYVKRGSEDQRIIDSLLNAPITQLTLELRFPEDGAVRDQLEIVRVVAEDWIDPERLEEP